MPVTRYQIRNEYGLADPELYRAADRDDPEALLEGVAMAGLVGVLRQLGDLAEFAAEIFHDLHEEVMATATRGHGLMVRVQQLEADFPSIEKALLSQTNHTSFFSNTGVDWHPNLRCEQNLVTRGDLPRFVMDSYEECRGPPRLFLLDKFDVAGAGACLKRYTDPSFFKVESTYSFSSVDMQRERKIRKVKQKKGSHWRNAETPEILLPSHAKLHELFLEERIENGYSDPARRVKLKKRHLNGSAIDSKTKKSYMDKFMETCSPERILVCAPPVTSPLLNLSSDNKNESGMRILDISIVSPAEKSPERNSASSSTNDQEVISKQSVDGLNGGSFYEETIGKVSVPNADGESDNSYSNLQMVAVEKELEVDEDKTEGSVEGYNSDDFPSEVDNYVDALATLESEMDTDNESRSKSNPRLMKGEKQRRDSDVNEVEHVELQAQSLDSQSNESSSLSVECNNSFERDRASLHSDTLSNLVENLPSECNGAAKEFPSTETYGTKETHIHEGIHPDSGDTSCNKLVREMSPTQPQPDRGENSPVASHMEPLLEKTSSGEVFFCSDSFDTKENETNLDHSMAVVPGDSSHAKNQFANTSLMLPLVEADEEDLGATSDDLLHLKNIEELTSVNPSGNNYVNEVYQTKCTDEDAVGSFFSRKIDAPLLSTPSTEDQLFPSAMKEVQTSSGTALLPPNSDVEKPVNRVSVVEDSVKPTAFKSGVIPWRRISRGSVAEGDTSRAHEQKDIQQTHVLKEQTDAPQTPVLMDQQISDLNEDVSHYEDNFNVEERSRTVDDEDIGLFTSSVDAEGGDSVSMQLPSNSPAYSGHGDHLLSVDIEPATVHEELPLNSPSHSGFDTVLETSPEIPPAMSNNIEDETAHAHDLALTAKSDDVNDIDTSPAATCSPPLSFMNLHESLPDFKDSHLIESEVDDVASPKFISDSELHKEVSNREVLPDSDSDPGISVARGASSSEVFDDDHDFFLDEQSGNGTTVCDVPTASTSLEMTNQESESQSLYQSHGEYTLSSSTFALTDPVLRDAESKLKIFLELQANQADMENLEEDGASDQLEAALESSPESHSDQLGKQHLQEDQTFTNSSISQSDDSWSPDQCANEISKLPSMEQINQQTCLDVSESLPENLPSQHSTSEICTESAGQETDILKQKMELLESFPPNCVQPPVVNLEDTPPLPPLPPMQWRLGKVQHASLASQREMEGAGQHLFFPMQPLKADEHTLFDLPEMRRELWQPTNPFLPLAAEDIKSGPFSGPSMGHVVPPGPYLQVPNDNDSDQQNNFSDLGGIQFSSPFIQSEICGDSSGHNDIALEGENGQTSSKSFTVPGTECSTSRQDPVFSHGDIVHPPHVTGLELEVCQQSFSNSKLEPARPLATSVTAPTMEEEQPQHSLPITEGENVQSTSKPLTVPLATSVTAPTMEEEQPQHSLPITEGENVQSTSKPLTVPGSEFTTSRHDPSFSHGETIQFLQQLPQDSSLEPENLCQALLDSEKEQENPLTGSITSTNKVDEKPQLSVPTSEVETAWSSEASNTSEVMPDSEVGKSNGTVNKLPRPRNPLIDAVTAHGQSKLKKVSERIQPQVEPKVDERDLFLQQIRTKSFNLKPATVTRSTPRPNIQVQNPNLKVISLLEKKAIAIRQAFAGSDEDDDDSWSDS